MKDKRSMTQIVKKKKKWGQGVIKKNGVINTTFLSHWSEHQKRGEIPDFSIKNLREKHQSLSKFYKS